MTSIDSINVTIGISSATGKKRFDENAPQPRNAKNANALETFLACIQSSKIPAAKSEPTRKSVRGSVRIDSTSPRLSVGSALVLATRS